MTVPTLRPAPISTATDSVPRRSAGRLAWVDVLKGLGIILVVLGHAVRGLHSAGHMNEALFHAFDSRIYAFHMPLFFLLSGIFLMETLDRDAPGRFLQRTFWGLIYPLVIWTYIFLAIKYLAGGFANQPVSLPELFTSPFPGYLHLWFIWALFLIQIFAFALRHPLRRVPRLAWLAGFIPLSLVLYKVPESPEVFYWVHQAKLFLPFVAIGMLVGQYRDRVQPSATVAAIAAVVFAAVIVAVPALQRQGVGYLPLALVLSALFITAGAGLRASPVTAGLASLGFSSMAIYLCHIIFSAGMREALLLAGITGVPAHLTLDTLAGCLIPLALASWARTGGWSGWLGWR